jgi:acetyl-CoA carboxylase biotin carboxyl carrier protein
MIDIAEIERIIALMEAADVAELSIEHDGMKIQVHRAQTAAAQVVAPQEAEEEIETTEDTAPTVILETKTPTTPIISPVVGIFHNGGMPNRRTVLKEGDRVKEGQVIAVIEAMKVPNELRAPCSGTISQILVEDGAGVEFGQTLLLIASA